MTDKPRAKDDPFQKAIVFWRSRSVSLLPPATVEVVDTAFAGLGIPLSSDVRRLYTTTRGFTGNESDILWSLWSLEQVVEENKDRSSEYVWFADWFVCSHMYAFHYNSPEASAVFVDYASSAYPRTLVAETIGDFLLKYLDNPENVEAWIPSK